MQIKNIILYPNNTSLREHAIAFEDCVATDVEKINFESQVIFHNSNISFKKILDILNIKKIIYIINKIDSIVEKSNEINLFTFAPELNYLLLFICIKLKFKNVKIWYLMHEPNSIERKVLKGYIVHIYNLIIFQLCDKIILASENAYNGAKKIFSNTSKMIIINLVFSSKPVVKSIEENRIVNNNKDNKYLYYGTGSYGKRPDRLNIVADILMEKFSNKEYKIVRAGKDIFKVNYRTNILVFSEYLEKSKIEELISNCKIIVLPYDFIVQSGIIVEALYHGKLVLASRIDGFMQYQSCESVFLVDFEDIISVEKKLHYLMNLTLDEYRLKVDLGQIFFTENHSYSYLRDRLNYFLSKGEE